MSALSLHDLYLARQRINGLVRSTPLELSPSLSRHLGTPVYLKLEALQTTGSFKLRGASNAIAAFSAEQRACGVVTASTGNHGRAVAHAAAQLGVKATVFLSQLVPGNKVQAIRDLGAEVCIVGHSQDDAQQAAQQYAEQQGAALIPPFDHPQVVAGQGTLGLEIIEQLPEVEQVLIPLSGGGLFAGVALAMKSIKPSITTHGISMQRGAAMHASLQAGRPVEVEELPTLADSLGGGIGLGNKHTLSMTQRLLDQLHLLPEASIANGMRHAYQHERLVVEGAGAVGIAALLDGLVTARGPVVVVVSGRNVDSAQHQRVINGGDA